MAKIVVFDRQARNALQRGASKVAEAVRVTLGPRGRNVAVERKFGAPNITNDGVSIAREIEFDDPLENAGALLMKEVANKTNDIAGDGTTTACVLAYAMIKEGLKNVAAGANPMFLKRGMDMATEAVVEELKRMARSVDTTEDIAAIGTIASHDPEIGSFLGQAFDKVGKRGVVFIEESRTIYTEFEHVEGMEFDRGYISPYMVTDPDKMEAVLEEPYILVTDKKISRSQEIVPLLEKISRAGKPLFIVCEDLEGEALATVVVNKLRGIVSCAAAKAPAYGDRRKGMLEDMAILTGGQVCSEERGVKLENVTLEELGRARRVRVRRDDTTIIEGYGSPEAIQRRIDFLRKLYDETTSEYDKDKLRERYAKLSGGVAVIKVGAPTEPELREKKTRVGDALAAVRAAIDEGIVPGGGVALLDAQRVLDNIRADGDVGVGVSIVRRALEEPLRQIAWNAGLEGTVVVEKVRGMERGWGLDALTLTYGDMVSRGIVDPAKVTRVALQNAASIASMLITTEAVVVKLPLKEEKAQELREKYNINLP